MVQFECDHCVFHKVTDRRPIPGNLQDNLLKACIRRILLDAFWSRATSTVTNHAIKIDLGIELCSRLGIHTPYLAMGPLPRHDHCGYTVALQLVLQSLSSGVYAEDHQQWDTIRKLRTAYSNQIRASALANGVSWAIGDAEGKSYQRICADPCASLWFVRFMEGCKRRMGQDWRPDRAISVELMNRLLTRLDLRAKAEEDPEFRHRWIMGACYYAICYVDSLRGPEGLLLDLEGIRDHFNTGTDHQIPYVTVALLGTVKGEHHSRQHLLPTAAVTDSGIQVRVWLRRVIALNYALGRTKGPALSDTKGFVYTTSAMNVTFQECLCQIFDEEPELFLSDIKSHQDIEKWYNVFRSLRRGSDSRAFDEGISDMDVDIVNRWGKKEKAGTSRQGMSMKHHYADVNLIIKPFLRYTQCH